MREMKKIFKSKFWPDDWEKFMADSLERSHKRLEEEMGYGIPETKQLKLFGDEGEDD